MEIGEIEVIEYNTLWCAEQDYRLRIIEGCWQMIKPLEVVWSWRKFRHVVRFSMRKVEKAYHIDDYLKDVITLVKFGSEVYRNISEAKKLNSKLK